jgi:hypothetical protein
LLSLVNRSLPTVPAVAMSGTFGASEIPEGISADAYHQKGRGIPAQLKAIDTAQKAGRPGPSPQRVIWIQKINYQVCSEDTIMMSCPDCFRMFPQPIIGAPSMVLDATCPHCGGSIVFALVPSLETVFAVSYQLSTRYGLN